MELISDIFFWSILVTGSLLFLFILQIALSRLIFPGAEIRETKEEFILNTLEQVYFKLENSRFLIQRRIHCFIQRRLYGYSYYDRWGLDLFLSQFLIRVLTDFRDSPHDAGPGSLKKTENWDDILTTMIEGFEAAKEISINHHTEELDKKFKLGMKNFQKYFFHLWT